VCVGSEMPEIAFEEDHTLGCLLQAYTEPHAAMCAYRQVHPLERKIVFLVAPERGSTLSDTMERALADLEEDIRVAALAAA